MISTFACGRDEESEHQEISLEVSEAKWSLESDTIRVAQGDTVTLNITSDELGTFHLHGYDIEIPVGPDETGGINFDATATGRFNITFHAGAEEGGDDDTHHTEGDDKHTEEGEEVDLGAIEVHPR